MQRGQGLRSDELTCREGPLVGLGGAVDGAGGRERVTEAQRVLARSGVDTESHGHRVAGSARSRYDTCSETSLEMPKGPERKRKPFIKSVSHYG